MNIVSSFPLTTHPSHYHLDEVTSSTPSQPHTVTVVCTPTLLPLSRTITISATYTTYNGKWPLKNMAMATPSLLCCSSGLPRVSEKVVELPLSLYCQPCEPVRAAQYKVGTPQYITVYDSISQYITVHLSTSQYMTVYHSISQYTSVHHSI